MNEKKQQELEGSKRQLHSSEAEDPIASFFGLLGPKRDIFDELLGSWRKGLSKQEDSFTWQPRVDIAENERAVTIKAALPGVAKENISVDITDGVLRISGERSEESEAKEQGYIRREQVYGSFHRSFALPDNVDQEAIKANYTNGVLKLELPKAPEKKKEGKRIAIT